MTALSNDEKTELEEYLKHICETLFGYGNYEECTVESKTAWGDTPLHVAAIMGNIRVVEMLIKLGADVNAVGEDGYTPLHEAIEQGNVEVVKMLIANSADTTVKTYHGATTLELAQDNEEIRTLLM